MAQPRMDRQRKLEAGYVQDVSVITYTILMCRGDRMSEIMSSPAITFGPGQCHLRYRTRVSFPSGYPQELPCSAETGACLEGLGLQVVNQ